MTRRIDKPWGHEVHFAVTERYVGKILFIRAGESLSLQYHRVKDESVYVLSGLLRLTLEEAGTGLVVRELRPGEAFRVLPGMRHRFAAGEDTTLVEVSTPELDDVVRLEDRYGRASSST